MNPQDPRPHVVYRQLAIPVDAFDHLKDTQRVREASTGIRLTLNDALALIVREHRALKTVEREARDHDQAHRTHRPHR